MNATPSAPAIDRPPDHLRVGQGAQGRDVAFRALAAQPADAEKPGLVWLGGFKSDMTGTKATALEQHAARAGRACLRFDYSGHGESGGTFEEGTISRWLEEALAVFRLHTQGPQILVGSSMGGWIALLLARELARAGEQGRIAGMVLIAPAVDFTDTLMWPNLSDEARREIETTGKWLRPSQYSPEPYPITKALIDDGKKHLLFGGEIRTYGPVHILQGMLDPDVPWRHALVLVEHLADDPAVLSFINDGDHRLSRDEDIERLLAAVDSVA
ncbi:MAG: alpha/beta fold hydrolase [Hyphomicrobiales bacterium]|nr:alpha/beta fold hydrolase [Hyphomicrobiales bacterium]